MSYTYKYPRPSVTADIAIFSDHSEIHQVLLIRRGNDPFKGQWALPGGFIEMDEPLIATAARELMEETGLSVEELTQFRAYGDPGRDPRGRTIAVVFYGFANPEKVTVTGGDDAADARWFALDQLPALAFDHQKIVTEIIGFLGSR
ncbi:MAG: NUDIX hydrolase [Clostridia bacterium]|nr:NUDIX hydrolase [Clostridia bacterium]